MVLKHQLKRLNKIDDDIQDMLKRHLPGPKVQIHPPLQTSSELWSILSQIHRRCIRVAQNYCVTRGIPVYVMHFSGWNNRRDEVAAENDFVSSVPTELVHILEILNAHECNVFQRSIQKKGTSPSSTRATRKIRGKLAPIMFGPRLFGGILLLLIDQNAAERTTTRTATPAPPDRPYKGRLIGKLQQLRKGETASQAPSFKISGTIYAVDEQLLYVDEFTYDGGIEGMLLWGISSDPRTLKHEVFIIPTSSDCIAAPNCVPLPAIWAENMLLSLPRNISLLSVSEIAVGTRDINVLFPRLEEKFASLVFPPGFTSPQAVILPSQLGQLVSAGETSSGRIIVQDSRRIFIEHVKYDGSGADAHFWVDRSPQPTPSGFMVPANNDEASGQPLSRLPKVEGGFFDALLDLRKAYRLRSGNIQSLTVFDLKSVAIYDRTHGIIFGYIPFDGMALKGKVPPALDDLVVQRISKKAEALLRELNYHLGADNGISTSGWAYPKSSLSSTRIQLAVADGMQNDDPTSVNATTSFEDSSVFTAVNSTDLKATWVLPISLNNLWNCEIVDNLLEAQWRIQGKYTTITLSAAVSSLPDPENSYIAFGISGSQRKTQMIGSDVTIGYVGPQGIQVVDYVLGGKSECNLDSPKVDAVCPRTLLGGKQVSRLLGGGGIRDGRMSFSFRRPLESQDILGKEIPVSFPVNVVWSVGVMNVTTMVPMYHTVHSKGVTTIHFGRTAQNNCGTNNQLAEKEQSPII